MILNFRIAPVVLAVMAFAMIGHKAALSQTPIYSDNIRGLIVQYCVECHQGDEAEADIDLSGFRSIGQLQAHPKIWQRVHQMLVSRQMPPKDADQPTDAQHNALTTWVREFLSAEATKHAGDPGPVTLRRLSNAEYDYTIADLIGVDGLNSTAEFPVDGAAGEGFTNTGDALGMSPAMVTKYLDAAKGISQHAVLLPEGIQFSRFTTQRDWTNESLERIRQFYGQFVDNRGKHLDWERKDANAPRTGRIPLSRYIEATLSHREGLQSGKTSIAEVADAADLSEQYLNRLWATFAGDQDQGFLIQELRQLWRSASPADSDAIAARIDAWQRKVWQFHSIGHLGRKGAPNKWMTAQDPLVDRQRLTLQLPEESEQDEFAICLTATNVTGDDAVVAWGQPTIQQTGNAPILLRDVWGAKEQLDEQRSMFLDALPVYLLAASEVQAGAESSATVRKYRIDDKLFKHWLAYLGIGRQQQVVVQGHFTEVVRDVGGYTFVSGWGSPATPSVVANSSAQQVRIPGIARAGSIVVHPSPELYAAIGWQSPIDGTIEIDAAISDAHPECGNGVQWWVQHRGNAGSTNVDQDNLSTRGKGAVQTARVAVSKGDLVSVIVGPRDGQHACDLTSVDLAIRKVGDPEVIWNLAEQVSSNILDGNPLPDSAGHPAVWHFYKGPVADIRKSSGRAIPADSLLATWKAARNSDERISLATKIKRLMQNETPPDESPDAVLFDQLHQFVGIESINSGGVAADPRFGRHPTTNDAADTDLFTAAPSTTVFRVPAELASGGKFSVDVQCESDSGSAAVQVAATLTEPTADSQWSHQPLLISTRENGKRVFEDALEQFRQLFPASLCYTKIVPVDEVVTLQLYYREDDHLKRLMCNPAQQRELDRLWDQLLFIAQEPLASETALEQSQQFATQDRPDLAVEFEELKALYRSRADAFRARLIGLEPKQLEVAIEFAGRAWRRNVTSSEADRLRTSYTDFRNAEMSHEEAIRLLIARILVAPRFLYRLEQPAVDKAAGDVSNHELATRLSYFLWSTTPDGTLRDLADRGLLRDQQTTVQQSRRMLVDPKIRRLAIHFACQWLHVRDFDQVVEKNERIYPEFAELRGDLYEEIVQFFTDMFRRDGSILDLLLADHTFVNPRLAAHYAIEGIEGPEWRRVENIQNRGRGGVLGMAAVLASQSGTSRTSPILRGNWVYETLLGQRLPRPPPSVPVLPDAVPDNKTARELIELHSGAPACARCHLKIDPYGFALEQFDTIGRTRPENVDTSTELPDGRSIDGIEGLRRYLVEQRRDDVVRQFCKKLLGYALGRGIRLSDEPLLKQMQQRLEADGYRFSIAVESIVTSPQFRQIRGRLVASEVVE